MMDTPAPNARLSTPGSQHPALNTLALITSEI